MHHSYILSLVQPHSHCFHVDCSVWSSHLLMVSLAASFYAFLSLCPFLSLADDMTVSLAPQFATSFATFRPAFSHSGSPRPLSVILPAPASPPSVRPPGSGSSSPTSKVPLWKVCSPSASMSCPLLFPLFCFCFAFHQMHTGLFCFHSPFHQPIKPIITSLLLFA